MVKRKHVELAIFEQEVRDGGEDVRMVGRVGVRIIEDVMNTTADGSLRGVLEAMPAESKQVGHMRLLYAFFDLRRDHANIAQYALDAFVPVLAQTVQKSNGEHGTATGTDSKAVWHLLTGSKLLKIEDGVIKGGMVFGIDKPT
jgi:hypothetical protein